MHFGLEPIIPYVLYLLFIVSFLSVVFWRPIWGIFYLLPLIPLQTLRYRTNDLPLGASIVGIMLLAIVLGLLRRGQSVIPKTPLTKIVCIYCIFTFASLWRGSFYLDSSMPLPGDPRFGVWQDYIVMPVLLLLVAAVQPTKRQMQAMIAIMCLSTFVLNHNFWGTISDRDFSSYNENIELLREGGGMGYAGTNGLAAFEAQAATFLLALAAFERRSLLRLAYRSLAVFSVVCLMYSFSRGGYVAFLVGWLFLGLTKQRTLVVLFVIFLCTWTFIVPHAVQQRVSMTYDEQNHTLDHSAETRISLWQDALALFSSNPVMGTGFNTYAYMNREKRADGFSGYYADTHNFFLKVLVESGVVGLLLFFWLVIRIFIVGVQLSRRAHEPFLASLGLGLAGWIVCSLAANCFGDRWTFLQINGYMWVLAGLVAHARELKASAVSIKDQIGARSEEASVLSEPEPAALASLAT